MLQISQATEIKWIKKFHEFKSLGIAQRKLWSNQIKLRVQVICTRFRKWYDENEKSCECDFAWILILTAELLSKIGKRIIEIE